MAKKKELPVIIWKEGAWFVAKTVGLELASQGKTKKQALANLQEAFDLYIEDEEKGFDRKSMPRTAELNRIYA